MLFSCACKETAIIILCGYRGNQVKSEIEGGLSYHNPDRLEKALSGQETFVVVPVDFVGGSSRDGWIDLFSAQQRD